MSKHEREIDSIGNEVEDEVEVIPLAYTCAEPWTVMVSAENTAATITTVKGTEWTRHVTLIAIVDCGVVLTYW